MKATSYLKLIGLEEKNFPIFFYDNWLQMLKKDNAKPIIFYDEIQEILVPVIIYKIKFIKKAEYIFAPLKYDASRLLPSDEYEFLNDFHKHLKTNKICDIIVPPSSVVNFKSIPLSVYYYKMDIINIDVNNEDIFKKMSSNYRNEIRKAMQSGVETSFNLSNINDFYSLYSSTYYRQKIQCSSLDKFISFAELLPSQLLIGVSKYNNKIETAVLISFDKIMGYYDSAGSVFKPVFPGSNKLLIYDAIFELKKHGVKKLIMGSYKDAKFIDNKNNGIQQFKLRFGADIDQGFHFVKIINPFKMFFFNKLLKLKSIIFRKNFSFFYAKENEIFKSPKT